MTPSEIVVSVQRHGANLAVEGQRLVIRGRGPRLPEGLREALRVHKAELLQFLKPQGVAALSPKVIAAAADTWLRLGGPSDLDPLDLRRALRTLLALRRRKWHSTPSPLG